MSSEIATDSPSGMGDPTIQIGGDNELPAQDVVTGRGMISGVSGAGKSNTAVVISEELLELGIPLVVIDPEGEFVGLRDEYPVVVFGMGDDVDARGDAAEARALARQAVTESVPVVFNLEEFSEDDSEEIASAVATALFGAERRHSTPLLFIVDELSEYLPEKGKTEATKAITRIAKRGRKRGLGILGVSQRPVNVSKNFVTQADYHLWHRLQWKNDTELAADHLPDGYEGLLEDLENGEVILRADWEEQVTQFDVRLKRVADLGATPSIQESIGTVPAERPDDLPDGEEDGTDELGTFNIEFDPGKTDLIERASKEGCYGEPKAFIQHAAILKAADVVDADGDLECPIDGCEETFLTERQLNGHLGSVGHSREDTDADYWCGHCGYGPTTWRGINAHHGGAAHDGDVIHLDSEPTPEDLESPDDVPDHKNPALLEELYEEYDETISEMCRQHNFDVTQGRVRHYLIDFGIHDVTPQGGGSDEDVPDYRKRDWLKERYDAADGNISEMHRNLEIDVPYRTLVKNIKRFDFHDPTDPPGKRHGKGGGSSSTTSTSTPTDDKDTADDQDREGPDPGDDLEPDEQVFILEWGRWGPPQSGTYHSDDGCWTLDRSDSDRDVVPLPWPRTELEEDDDWKECGHCSRSDGEGDAGDEDATADSSPTETAGEQEDVTEPDPEVDAEPDPEPDPEPEPEPEPETESEPEATPATQTPPVEESAEESPRDAVLLVEDPADVSGFADVETPDWLDEGTFYSAAEMADDVGEFADVLGWHDYDHLEVLVGVLDVDVEGGVV